ncbi:hypothetical protein L6164_007937 [Bauhinia variegata]|uniref:Uncharacterized protein n=1 Tax=Bauhinia variegata TaxID=167791 RepID=A0ACB9PF49_BAUVA|nr:hypothetical protein L6164_007937 [Bauhinia variegata]
MNQLGISLLVLYAILLKFCCKAQTPDPEDGTTKFQPNLAVFIGILCLMFFLTLIVLMCAKFWQRRTSVHGSDTENHSSLISPKSRFSGIDKTVIESLPFFRFSSLKGSREGLECAVCLSMFEDVEILRMLPKCRHAFHIDCIDNWLEKHASCPLCRCKVNPEDKASFDDSNSMSLILANQSELGEESSNIELFVEREEEHNGSSSFSIGSSFRKIEKGIEEQELPMHHKQNHRIIVSDVILKNRWSNVSSSDIMFLKSEMLSSMSSRRFKWESYNDQEMERKIPFDIGPSHTSDSRGNSSHTLKYPNKAEKRSMSEIISVSRFGEWGMKGNGVFRESSLLENNVKEERVRQLWLPIARRTVQWFVNRERSQQSLIKQQPLDI